MKQYRWLKEKEASGKCLRKKIAMVEIMKDVGLK